MLILAACDRSGVASRANGTATGVQAIATTTPDDGPTTGSSGSPSTGSPGSPTTTPPGATTPTSPTGSTSPTTGTTGNPATTTPASLPTVAAGARPGPDLLYAAAPPAPQLENVAPWTAAPILVSGATAYRRGEFLYQDFLYDDHGSNATATYPTDKVYAGNAADLVEFRVRPLANATAFRVTVNSLLDAQKVAFTVALGASPATVAWPHGAGVTSPAAMFLTVHGTQAELLDAASGKTLSPAPTVTVDTTRRQFDVRVSHVVWSPGSTAVRMAAGVGVWNATTGAYLVPTSSSTTPTLPTSNASTAALYNVAFRAAEPISAPWRDSLQGSALASGDISAFSATVDFARLLAGASDESGVPQTGTIDRIYSSRFEPAQGIDASRTCGRYPDKGCDGTYVGRLQPYALYVPARATPTQGWGMTLLLHELGASYNAYAPMAWPKVLGERGAGSLVLTPEGRGVDGDYIDLPEADVFEAWADVARHYPLDAGWAASAGYSMGGGGTLKMLARWPDLFGRGMSLAAVPQYDQGSHLETYRNNPLMIWIGNQDEGTPPYLSLPVRSDMTKAGLYYTWYQLLTEDHFLVCANDAWTGVPEFLGSARALTEVPHLTYTVDPRFDSARAGVADHYSWMSGLAVRDATASPTATVDARSLAYGLGDPTASGEATSAGVLMGGTQGPQSYQSTVQTLSVTPTIVAQDKLVIGATNLAKMTVNMRRAKLTCDVQVVAATDGPLDVDLDTCPFILRFTGQPTTGGVSLPSGGILPNVCDPTGALPSGLNCASDLPAPIKIFKKG